MSAYLLVDVDDIREYLEAQHFAPNILDVAMSLRNTAALAAGLTNSEDLKAIAIANWNTARRSDSSGVNVQQVFVSCGYDLFNVSDRRFMSDAILTAYFPMDSEAGISELIIASSQVDFLKVLDRLHLPPQTRVRVWADVPPNISNAIYQPLQAILGVKSKTVALYVDFENISISLNEQGYIVDLDILISALKQRAGHYGQLVHSAAYAPWGQRGSLPPMLDSHGREISDDIPSRLAVESIDPVFSLPGKNSADLRIAKDVLAESGAPNSPEIIIIASGDRDFNDIYNSLRARGKQIMVWGVRGSTSRVLENNASIKLEYIDDFALFRRHKELLNLFEDHKSGPAPFSGPTEAVEAFRPSQWSSLILQFDLLKAQRGQSYNINLDRLARQLDSSNATANYDRAVDLIKQAIQIGILQEGAGQTLDLRPDNPLVSKTHLIRDHIVTRVQNTLQVRNWEYVNYGFLLKGIAMDEKLIGYDLNIDDNWRSEWIDFLVREGILERELIPHRHNPDDLVPVISVPNHHLTAEILAQEEHIGEDEILEMSYRIIVSVEQFTSFRKFIWCPLGSLHKRLRPFDPSTSFQHAVEHLQAEGAILIEEYANPQSNYLTKGVSLVVDSPLAKDVLGERNRLIVCMLERYDKRLPINLETIQQDMQMAPDRARLWISILELENVLNPVIGQPGQYSLFRTHHTVSIVAGD
jgi:hypothetical protein